MPEFLQGIDCRELPSPHWTLQETFGCRGWSWTEITCQLFGGLGEPVISAGSVSGPPSCTALLVSGGYPHTTSSNTAEIFLPFTMQHCRLPDIPGNPRWYHTMEDLSICGGLWSETDVRKTCLTLRGEGWEVSSHLLHQRPYHSSWASPSGDLAASSSPFITKVVQGVRLMGGDVSSRSSEVIQEDGSSQEGFQLEHSTQ